MFERAFEAAVVEYTMVGRSLDGMRKFRDLMPRMCSALFLALLLVVFVISQIVALLSNMTLDGESAIGTNVVIEYLTNGLWRFPIFAHERYFPGVQVYIMHPPLHYFLVALWVKCFGVGTWQFLAQSTGTGIAGAVIVAVAAYRTYGPATVYVFLALLTAFFGFYFSTQQMRPDLELGTFLMLFLVLFSRPLLSRLPARDLAINSFMTGLAAIASLASHWHGYLAQAYLPVFLFVLYRLYRSLFWPNVTSLAVGVFLGLGAWWLLFGSDLPKALVLALMGGVVSRTALGIPLRNALYPYVDWPGGLLLIAGFVSFLAITGVRLAKWARSRGSTPKAADTPAKADWLLLGHVLAFATFYLAAVGNHGPYYAANTYFLVVPAAARGYVLLLGIAATRLTSPGRNAERVTMVCAAVFALGLMIASPMTQRYFRPNIAAWRNPNAIFTGLRAHLRQFVPERGRTVIGGDVYPYLYDITYRSTAQIVSEHLLNVVRGETFVEVLKGLIRQRREMNPANVPASVYRDHLVRDADTFVITETTHSWQDYFNDPRVWEKTYEPVATVFVAVRQINQPEVEDRWFLFRPRYFTVYGRSTRPGPLAQPGSGETPRIVLQGDIGIIHYGSAIWPVGQMTNTEWAALPAARKRDLSQRYVHHYQWSHSRLDDRALDRLADALRPLVDEYFSRYAWGSRVRILTQAMDYAIANVGVVDVMTQEAAPTRR